MLSLPDQVFKINICQKQKTCCDKFYHKVSGEFNLQQGKIYSEF